MHCFSELYHISYCLSYQLFVKIWPFLRKESVPPKQLVHMMAPSTVTKCWPVGCFSDCLSIKMQKSYVPETTASQTRVIQLQMLELCMTLQETDLIIIKGNSYTYLQCQKLCMCSILDPRPLVGNGPIRSLLQLVSQQLVSSQSLSFFPKPL